MADAPHDAPRNNVERLALIQRLYHQLQMTPAGSAEWRRLVVAIRRESDAFNKALDDTPHRGEN